MEERRHELVSLREQWEAEKLGLGDVQKVRQELATVEHEFSQLDSNIKRQLASGETPGEQQFQQSEGVLGADIVVGDAEVVAVMFHRHHGVIGCILVMADLDPSVLCTRAYLVLLLLTLCVVCGTRWVMATA